MNFLELFKVQDSIKIIKYKTIVRMFNLDTKTFKKNTYLNETISGENSFFIYLENLFSETNKTRISNMKEEIYSGYFAYSSHFFNDIYEYIDNNKFSPYSKDVLELLKNKTIFLNILKKMYKLREIGDEKIEQSYITDDFLFFIKNKKINYKEIVENIDLNDTYVFFIELLERIVNLDITKYFKDNSDLIINKIEKMTHNEKIDYLKANDHNVDVITVDSLGMLGKGFDTLFVDRLLNPENFYIKSTTEKYMKYMEGLKENQASCDMLKTVIFSTIYLMKNKKGVPFSFMKNVTEKDSHWAVGTEDTGEASFYGNNNMMKAFSVYYNFMEGKKNPYSDIIDNNDYVDMENDMLKLHKYLKDHDLEEEAYKILFESKIAGNKSIMDILGTTSDLFKVLEEPIIAGLEGDILSMLTGIISSIMNSTLAIIDFGLTGVMKILFYKQFIQIGKRKYSIGEIYDYLNFIKLILLNYDSLDEVEAMPKEEYFNHAFDILGIRMNNIEKIGFGAYSSSLNNSEDTKIVYKYNILEKGIDGKNYEVKEHSKVLYTVISFAIQKRKKLLNIGNKGKYGNEINLSSETEILNLINSLDENETFWLFDKMGINDDFNMKIGGLSEKELFEFNNTVEDLSYEYDLDDIEFYEYYEKENLENLLNKKNNINFSSFLYEKYLNACIDEYLKKVSVNKRKLKIEIFDENNISNADDFLVRFLPSIKILCRTLGINSPTISTIVEIIEFILSYVVDIIFKKLFIGLKSNIFEMFKGFTDKLEEELNKNKSTLGPIIIDLNLPGAKISDKIDAIIKKINEGISVLGNLKDCFNNVSMISKEEKEDLEHSGRVNIKQGESIFKRDLTIRESWEEDISNNIDELFYKNGTIYGETIKGEKILIIDAVDSIVNDEIITNHTINKMEVSNKNSNELKNNFEKEDIFFHKKIIGKDTFDKLIEVRDFINNATNSKLSTLINEINKLSKKIKKELGKNKIDLKKIKDLEKEKAKLTEIYKNVKNNTGTFTSNILKEESNSEISVTVTEENQAIKLHDFRNDKQTPFLEKYEVLKKVEEIVIEHNIPMTNSEILKLIK